MATELIKRCDVYKWLTLDVATYELQVTEIGAEGAPCKIVYEKQIDASERGLTRLLARIEQGVTPPKRRKAKDVTG